MDKYPFTPCLHPRKIRNPYTKEFFHVGCGICSACSINRSRRMSLQCSLEETYHKYCMFVTLSYSDKYIPRCRICRVNNTTVDLVGVTERLNDYGVVLADGVSLTCLSEKMFVEKWHNYDMPYLSKRDLQLFLKRFRKRIYKDSNEKIRFYAVGEYGPVHFRPHFHLLFFFDEEKTLQNFGNNLYKSWKFGRLDFSLSRHKCGSYVAQYVNSSVSLPKIYGYSPFKPFALHSQFFALGLCESKRKEIYEAPPQSFMRQSRNVFGKLVTFMPWRSLTSYFFPRCKGYSIKSDEQKYYSYNILRKAWIYYGLHKPCVLAKIIVKASAYEENEITRYFGLSPRYPMLFADFDKAVQRIYSELHLSYHFLTFCCDNGEDYGSRILAFKRIVNFYNCREYTNLVTQYEQQIEYVDEFGLDGLSFFYDTSELDDIDKTKVYKQYLLKCSDDLNKSIKHKKLNDLNNIFLNLT